MLSCKMVQRDGFSKHLLLIHGIMGSSKNLMNFANLMLQNGFEDYQIILPDLDHSRHTVQECADDVSDLMKYLEVEIDLIVGHSFGGKVALLLNERMPVRQVWVWDAEPGLIPLGPTYQVLQKLKRVQMPQPNRQALRQAVLDEGLKRDIAAWMTTNLKESPGGLVWRFDLNRVQELLESFSKTAVVPGENVHFVRADRSSHMLLRDFERMYTIDDAGHWVHIDNPAGLINIMQRALDKKNEPSLNIT